MTMQSNVVIHREFPLHRRTNAPTLAGPIFEAVTYAGAAIALAALGTWVFPRWSTWSGDVQPILPGIAAITLLVLGWLIRDEDNQVARRVTGAVWAFGTLFVAWFVWALTAGSVAYAGPWLPLIVAGSTVAVAIALWALHRHTLQVIAVVTAVLATAYVGLALLPAPADWMYAMTFVGLGVIVIGLAALGQFPPRTASFVMGALAVLIAPVVAITVVTSASTPIRTWLFLGVGLAAALSASGVLLRSVSMRVLGALGLFGFVTALIQRYYVDTTAFGLTVAILGAVMVLGALAGLWLYEPGMRPSAGQREATPGEIPGAPVPVETKAEGRIAI
jgi:hypothetical protein